MSSIPNSTDSFVEGTLQPDGQFQRQVEIQDGIIYDASTGELLGVVGKEKFVIDSEEAAQWVLDKMQTCEATIVSIDNSVDVLKAKAIIANAEKMRAAAEGRLLGLHIRFDRELAQFVKPLLKNGSKTYSSFWGSVSFRKQTEKIDVKKGKGQLALELIGTSWRNAVKKTVKLEFQPSKLSPTQQKSVVKILSGRSKKKSKDEIELWKSVFDYRPAGEKIEVKTSVVVKPKESAEEPEG